MEFNLKKIQEFVEKGQKAQEAVDQLLIPGKNGNDGGQALVPVDLNLDTAKPRFAEFLDRVVLFEKSAEALEVRDQESREAAANLAGGAKKLIKTVDARRLEVTEQARKFVSSVNGFVDKFTDRLKNAAKIAGDKELQYVDRQEMARREAEKKAQEAVAKAQAEVDKEAKEKGIEAIKIETPVVPETKTTARTEAGVTSFTVKTWVCDVFDWTRIPQEYWSKKCSHVQENLDEAVKNGVRGIAGCFIHEKTGIRHRG